MANVNTYIGIDGKEYKVDWSGAEGFKSNNWFRRGTKSQVNAAIEFFLKNGVMPTINDIDGVSQGQWGNVKEDLESWMELQGLTEDSFSTHVAALNQSKGVTGETMTVIDPETGNEVEIPAAEQAQASDIETPFYQDPNKVTEDGSKEKAMVDLYRQANEETRGLYDAENQRARTDLMKEMDNQRRSTLDEIRNRRRTMLKNGLSSSQIANEEVQSLMMANNNNRMIGENFFNERSRINNTFAQNDANAEFNVMDMFNTMNQNGAGFAAAKAGDADYMAQLYRQHLNQGKYNPQDYNNIVNPGGK